ncbi:MAG: Nif3-like dinuclear metal center hexameric protein [Firmicutes bacterium]|nr:Nif3-like dinuclear metal center hexameric protein [Bacillota bacterium]
MYAVGSELVSFVEEIAPLSWALPGDASGLQWGDLSRREPGILLALDFSLEVLAEATAKGISFIITHHPFLYRPLSCLDLRHKRDALIAQALKEDITLYAAHTNLDVAPRGVNQALGELFGLDEMQLLYQTGHEGLEKLVVFVPAGYEDEVRQALAEAGAGWIGNYSHCTFQHLGTGTFLPREGSSPFIGAENSLEKVREYRLETILYRRDRRQVIEALLAVHPYEEVAYDLYPLVNEKLGRGLGRIGRLTEKITLRELAARCDVLLQPDFINVIGDLEMCVEKVAVLGGSGAEYIPYALQCGAQVYISGDIKYHEAQEAAREGLALIDAGHAATERPVLPVLARFLEEKIDQAGLKTRVTVYREQETLWQPLKRIGP